MNQEECFVNLKEAGRCVLDAMSNEQTKNVFAAESKEFSRGALWGMAWAMNHIYANCSKYMATRNDGD